MEQTYGSCSCPLKNESVNKMKFVFDLDGTPSVWWCHTDDEIQTGILLRAEEFLVMKLPLP